MSDMYMYIIIVRLVVAYYYCRLNYTGLFGWNLVAPNTTEIVLTSNEFDAMAVHQSTGMVALALPKSASTLPQQVRIHGYHVHVHSNHMRGV